MSEFSQAEVLTYLRLTAEAEHGALHALRLLVCRAQPEFRDGFTAMVIEQERRVAALGQAYRMLQQTSVQQ